MRLKKLYIKKFLKSNLLKWFLLKKKINNFYFLNFIYTCYNIYFNFNKFNNKNFFFIKNFFNFYNSIFIKINFFNKNFFKIKILFSKSIFNFKGQLFSLSFFSFYFLFYFLNYFNTNSNIMKRFNFFIINLNNNFLNFYFLNKLKKNVQNNFKLYIIFIFNFIKFRMLYIYKLLKNFYNSIFYFLFFLLKNLFKIKNVFNT